MRALRPALRLLETVPLAVASITLFALMLLTFADVVLRSAFNAPIEAATELVRLAMAVVVFSALPILSWRDHHIAVDLLDKPFARFRLSRARDVLVSLSCGAMLWWPAGRVVDLAERARSYGDRTEYLGIPDFYMGWFIAVMTYAAAVMLILRGLALAFAPRLLERRADD